MSQELNGQKTKVDTSLIEGVDKTVRAIKLKKYKERECIENSGAKEKKWIGGDGGPRRRNYRPFESRTPRERNACPECNSINVAKRKIAQDYKCYRCGWTGKNIIKVIY